MSNFNNIIDNKIKYEKKFSIDLTVESIYTVDYGDWINRTLQDDFDVPWNSLNLTVDIDGLLLYQGTVGIDGAHLHYDMLDTNETQQHSIKVVVSGFAPAHSFFHNGREINAQLVISQFKIEHLDLIPLISPEGIKILDNQPQADADSHELLRGDQSQIMNFSTPIYPWLLSKFSYINHH